MSASGTEFREVEYLGLGFLAVNSTELLDRLIEGKPIDDEDDKYTLRRAETFLRDVSSGAQLVASGVSNASAVETVRKLSYSVEPLALIQQNIRTAEVGQAFEDMAQAIEDAVTMNAAASAEQGAKLRTAKNFFRELHLFLIGQMEANQQRTGSDWELTQIIHA